MSHRTKFMWIPAEKAWHLICLKCGEELADSIEALEFDIPGECEPGERLGIHVNDTVGLKDIFGGK